MDDELCAAIAAQDLALIHKLIKEGKDPDALNSGKYLPLNIAVDLCNIDIIKCLVASNCSVNKRNGFGRLPLHEAAMTNKSDAVNVIKFLLDCGGLPDTTDFNGETPLMTACYWSNADSVDILATHVSNVNYQAAITERAAIHYAAMRDDARIINVLLSHGADPDLCDDDQETPLIIATRSNIVRVVEALLAKNCCLNYKGFMDYTALHWAVYSNHATIVRLLLDHGASVNEPNCLNRLPLHMAASCNAVDSAWLLLEAGAQTECVDSSGITPLLAAVQLGHSAVVKVLLHANANADHCTKENCSPLMLALEKMHINVAVDLVSVGCTLESYWENRQSLAPSGDKDFFWHMAHSDNKLTSFIKHCLHNVDTLQHLCRCTIRRQLPRSHQIHRDIQQLNLPTALKHYVAMDELLTEMKFSHC
ncbi:hypothetical protein LSH36_217g01035 [Paralvinella palmiformis]|uniref:SOCS box domain-containing protein n=1 Tax=Paralvinella palmiformis TaxID=53620 RepID=A0AAD9JN39_9ANNE|nr:hypothetical protein LSH36_217g01035 [Paralvinella palmiformis]